MKLCLDATSGIDDLHLHLISSFRHKQQNQNIALGTIVFHSILDYIKHRKLKALPVSFQDAISHDIVFYNVYINLPIFDDQWKRVDDLFDILFLLLWWSQFRNELSLSNLHFLDLVSIVEVHVLAWL